MKKTSGEKSRELPKGKKRFIVTGALLVAGICVALALAGVFGGETSVKFNAVEESELPKDITADIIPEYKTLERALACVADEDVYVVVTRGEKPTSGFRVSVEKIVLEEKDGKDNLIVYALFEDPDKETAISQIITYPSAVVKTNLKELPDEIELRIKY